MSDEENEHHPGVILFFGREATPDELIKVGSPPRARSRPIPNIDVSEDDTDSEGNDADSEAEEDDDDVSERADSAMNTSTPQNSDEPAPKKKKRSSNSGTIRKKVPTASRRRPFSSLLRGGAATPSGNTRSKCELSGPWSAKRLRVRGAPTERLIDIVQVETVRKPPVKTPETERRGRGRPRKDGTVTPSTHETPPVRRSTASQSCPKARRRTKNLRHVVQTESSASDDDDTRILTAADAFRRRTHYMTIVCKEEQVCSRFGPGIEIVGPEFLPRVPKSCNEACRANETGSWDQRVWPGIPLRKYNYRDQRTHGVGDRDWPVQSVYFVKPLTAKEMARRPRKKKVSTENVVAEEGVVEEAPEALEAPEAQDCLVDEENPDNNATESAAEDPPPTITLLGPVEELQPCVLYEGWTAGTMMRSNIEYLTETCPEMVALGKIRHAFLETRRRDALARIEMGLDANYEEQSVLQMRKKVRHLFWLFEDLTYFHTVANRKRNMSAVFYMACDGSSRVRPPLYTFTPFCIVDYEVFKDARKRPASLPFKDIPGSVFERSATTACEKPETCVCDSRFSLLYPDVEKVMHKADGTISLDFDPDSMHAAIECSDVCGCSRKCPRRRLQQGHSIPVCVYYEGMWKGFGLRTMVDVKKGELIGEYTGDVFFIPADESETQTKGGRRRAKQHVEPTDADRKDQSYEACTVALDNRLAICAYSNGNAPRFINHSCDPNTLFVEVYSRRYESDVLIPRIAVYALKDVALGEELTISYWSRGQLLDVDESNGVKCRCNSSNCAGWLPCK